jgi:hypothetical protein
VTQLGLARLSYELLDAHVDTVLLAQDLDGDPLWHAHLDYLRDLQRVVTRRSRSSPTPGTERLVPRAIAHETTLPPHPLHRKRSTRPQRAPARATASLSRPSPAHHTLQSESERSAGQPLRAHAQPCPTRP